MDSQFLNPQPLFNPWRRRGRQPPGFHNLKMDHFGKFDEFVEENMDLNSNAKDAALKASPFVVCLKSYIGCQRLFIGSGIITESDGGDGEFSSTILTSATLLRDPTNEYALPNDITVDVYLRGGFTYEGEIVTWDFHYNIAAIRIKSSYRLDTAVIANVEGFSRWQLVSHRDSFVNLCPGMAVIALGRCFSGSFSVMAAPGTLRLEDCGFDCEQLFTADCKITKNGIGGPLIDYSGRVIGMSFYKSDRTPFLPINIALKCLDHLQKFGEVPRPWLGIKLSDLETAGLSELEKSDQSFRSDLRGVIVRKVKSGSPASFAGIQIGDIITEFDGKPVENSLKFSSIVLDKAKEPSEVIVKRAGSNLPLTLLVLPQTPTEVNRWPVPEEWKGFMRD